MPLPKTKNVGKVISFLKKDKPGMPKKQKIAIALSATGKANPTVDDVLKSAKRKVRKKK